MRRAGLDIEVRNLLPVGRAATPDLPGSGNGIIGLTERVSLAGGQIDCGPTDGGEVIPAVRRSQPTVVLMDIRMPKQDGLATTEALLAEPNAPHVIVLTTFDADEYVLRALRAGASGFLLKDTPPADIADAIRRVAAGEPMLSPTVMRSLIDHVADASVHSRRRAACSRLNQLSDREREVAIAVGQGKSNAEISAELFMSVATVKAHVSRLMVKLELSNRVQIALLAHDAGAV